MAAVCCCRWCHGRKLFAFIVYKLAAFSSSSFLLGLIHFCFIFYFLLIYDVYCICNFTVDGHFILKKNNVFVRNILVDIELRVYAVLVTEQSD